MTNLKFPKLSALNGYSSQSDSRNNKFLCETNPITSSHTLDSHAGNEIVKNSMSHYIKFPIVNKKWSLFELVDHRIYYFRALN